MKSKARTTKKKNVLDYELSTTTSPRRKIEINELINVAYTP